MQNKKSNSLLPSNKPLSTTTNQKQQKSQLQPVTKSNHQVRVVARIRPLLSGESVNFPSFSVTAGKRVISKISSTEIAIINPRNTLETVKFTLDGCFDEESDQLTLFQEEIFPLLTLVMQGTNVSIFAYGNTGAGKTFTMLGCEKKPGIIPRTVRQLFTIFSTKSHSSCYTQAAMSCKYELQVSFFEIYNEKVYDLIRWTGQDLGIREDQQRQIIIPGLAVQTPANFEEFQSFFAAALKNRSTAATNLNSTSSRSHSVLLLVVKSTFANGDVLRSKVHLIDLAGSEDNRKTENSGIRMVESSAINKSLFVLGSVVDALNAANGEERRIPYRDSKLTRILQDSVGGKAKSLMIANLSPSEKFLLESHNTLCFASKSRQICNQVIQQIPQKPPSPLPKHSNSLAKFVAKNSGECTFLLSPMLKRRRVISDELAERCEVLERKLILKEGKIPIDISKKLSPASKTTLKNLNSQMKVHENNFDYAKAIECAKQITSIVPWDAKAQKRLQSLQRTHDSILGQLSRVSNSSAAGETHDSAYVSNVSLVPKNENMENVFCTPTSQLIPSPSQANYPAESESLRKRRIAEAELLYIFNNGTKNDLLKVKGIGKKRAEQIAAYRITKGQFQSIEDFLQVEGVTQKILDNILLLKVAETVLSG